MRTSVSASDLKDAITKSRSANYKRSNLRVVGKFDLKHEIIPGAIDLSECEFVDDVDLRYCEFKGTVNLSGCIFGGAFNSGDKVESHTIYRKDLVCNNAVFCSHVSLNGARIEGSAYFSKAVFGGDDQANLSTVFVGKTLECDNTIFEGSVSFAGLTCGGLVTFMDARFKGNQPSIFSSLNAESSIVFDNVHFESGVDFELAQCARGGLFRNAIFSSGYGGRFVQSRFGSNFECAGATFEGPAIFNSISGKRGAFFQNAVFEDEVELSYATFEGLVDCSETRFRGDVVASRLRCTALYCNQAKFESQVVLSHLHCTSDATFQRASFAGIASFGYATFGNTVNFDNAIFESSTVFASLQCTSNAFFHNTEFRGLNETNFAGASFGANFECINAAFGGPCIFSGLACEGDAYFQSATFFGKVDFGYVQIHGTLMCRWTTFFDDATFAWSKCRIFDGRLASFNAKASFYSAACVEGVFLRRACFRDDVTFSHMRCGVSLECDLADFRSTADFNSLNCGESGLFRGAFFQDVDFSSAHFGKNLSCNKAIFEMSASFVQVVCGDSGFFNHCVFMSRECQISWAGASFEGNLECARTSFYGLVNLNRTVCNGSAIFQDAVFNGNPSIRMEFSRFGRNLNFINSTISGSADLTMFAVQQSFKLTDSNFRGAVNFYEASAQILVLANGQFPFIENSLDLRGFSFSRFEGSMEHALRFARSQNPEFFVRDPYLQLEKYHENSGNEVQAKRMHYFGRKNFRESVKNYSAVAKWTTSENIGDWIFKWLTGYGVQTWRLLFPIGILLIAGVFVLWPATSSDLSLTGLIGALAYSVDLFVPLVNVSKLDEQTLDAPWRRSYIVLHSVLGWVLLPLLIASISGLVRRR